MMEQLPEGWIEKPIKDLSYQINGKAFKPAHWTGKGIPIIKIQNLNNKDATYNLTDIKVEEKFHIKKGDLLFAWSGTPGTSFGAHIWDRDFAYLNQHIYNLIIKNGAIDKRFYFYALKTTVEKFIQYAQGTAGLAHTAHITKRKFEDTYIPLPPLDQQKRIVAKLDQLFAHLDQLKARVEKIPQLL